ncbi:hypothetical protein ACRQ5Q_22240 [Bradyrhizobium sp. PMVTL-01]|uniref:hypothetical protein n=1 Tax=Bradyrhizobium sp. PMVTL-01 TaxID=3434999 RepID=UPI003F6F8D6A
MSANGVLPTIQQNLNVQIASPNGSSLLVSGASIQAIGANASRRGLIFINGSAANIIYLVPANQAAVVGQGIPILPQASREFIGDGRLINFNSGWNVISDGVNVPLEILELL